MPDVKYDLFFSLFLILCMHNQQKHPCKRQALRACARATTQGLESIRLLWKNWKSLRFTCSFLQLMRSDHVAWSPISPMGFLAALLKS